MTMRRLEYLIRQSSAVVRGWASPLADDRQYSEPKRKCREQFRKGWVQNQKLRLKPNSERPEQHHTQKENCALGFAVPNACGEAAECSALDKIDDVMLSHRKRCQSRAGQKYQGNCSP